MDDDPAIRGVCTRSLGRLGHRVSVASDVEGAVRHIVAGDIDVVVTDLHMPEASGLSLLSRIRDSSPGIRVILMSGGVEATDAAIAIEHGIDRLLLKPFTMDELDIAVSRAIAAKRASEKSERARQSLSSLVREREDISRIWILRSAHALAAAVEAKDTYTAGHAARVTEYGALIAGTVGGIDLQPFRLGGGLHDVGKIGLPDHILNKPGRLSADEFALVRKHPRTGARILEPLIDDPVVIGMVLWHHERWDGAGYPDGLSGENIPLSARVLAVADTLDAMTSSRAYRGEQTWDTAVAEIRRGAGTQFDPAVVTAFNQVLPELVELRASFGEPEEFRDVSGNTSRDDTEPPLR